MVVEQLRASPAQLMLHTKAKDIPEVAIQKLLEDMRHVEPFELGDSFTTRATTANGRRPVRVTYMRLVSRGEPDFETRVLRRAGTPVGL